MLAVTYFVSWNTAPLKRFLLAALVLVAVVALTMVIVTALTPVVVGCCSYAVANAWQLCMIPVVFGGAMAVKP